MLRLKTLAFCMFLMANLFGQKGSFEAEKVSFQKYAPTLQKEFKAYETYRMDYQAISQFVQSSGEEIELNLKLGNDYDWNLQLYPNDIRGPEYQVYVQTENGVEVMPQRPNMTFRGYLDTKNGGKSGFTINEQHFAGTVRQNGKLFFVEPLHYLVKDAPRDIIVVYDAAEVIPHEGLSCGADELLENIKDKHDSLHDHDHDHDHDHEEEGMLKQDLCLEVDLAIASDWLMFLDYNSSVTQVEDHNITVMNNVATNYDDEFNDEIVFVIVTQFVSDCSTCDPWSASTNAGTLLSSFRNWGNNGGFGVQFDLGQIWTDRNFNGGTVGVAYVPGLCNSNKYHALQDFSTNQNSLRVLTSHEIGHNFSSGHDAAGSGFIMAPSVNNTNTWSGQSQNAINNLITQRYNTGTCFTECVTVLPPVADFVADQLSGCIPLDVNFTDLTANAPTTWSWSFPGGTPSTSNDQNPFVIYNASGFYDVTLTVSNSAGTNTITKTSYINAFDIPSTNFTHVTDENLALFTNNTLNATSYNWDFGDGETSVEINPIHFYQEDGTYTVTLTATNICGVSVFTQLVTIATLPLPNFMANQTIGCAPLVVAFEDQSSSNTEFWLWEMPGASPDQSGEQNPNVVYNTPGTYDVTLTVINGVGSNSVTFTDYIIVEPTPLPEFTFTTTGTTVDFNNISTEATSYSWDFGDGNTSDLENPSHTYDNGGTFTVVLTAINDCGEETYVLEVVIAVAPTAGIGADTLMGCADFTVQFLDNSSPNVDSWAWSFPGGNPDNSSEQNPLVVYENAGIYDVTLIVTNAIGSDTVTEVQYISITDVPSASFTSSTNDLTVDFTNTTMDADSYSWDFGDGESSTEENPSHTYDEDGTYVVVLTATNECGTVTTEEVVTIVTAPVAGFSANVISGCADLTVEFSDESTTNATSWEWTFEGGNPSSSTEQNPTVVYENAGTFTVTLEVTNAAGANSITETNYITVEDVPNAGFTSTANDLTVDFTNTSTDATSYSWDFGDGESSVEEDPSHTYDEDGTYTVILTATNDCGSVTTEEEVTIVTAPVAGFSANTTSGCTDLTVEFSDESTTNATSWEWTFDGGNPSSSTEQNPTVIYETAGTYTVTLEVTNGAGSNSITETNYIIVEDVPNANFTSTTNDLTVDFTNTSTDATSYSWDFGDGESSTEEDPSHTYDEDGTYTVILTATNDCGSVTTEEEVTIVTAPVAGFSANTTSGCTDLTVAFSDESTTNATSWEWTFDGGNPSSSTEQNPTVVYETAGTYTVTLEVTNAAGSNSITETNYIIVEDVPNADFTSTTNDLTVDFTNTSTDATSYSWDFGDGESSTEEDPSHTYDEDGTYTVILTATNDCGSVTTEEEVTIVTAPVAGFSANTTSGCTDLTVEFSDESTTNATSWEWTFDGGSPSSSTEQNPTVIYETAGTYTVTLEVTNGAGSNSITETNYIIVEDVPNADFTSTTNDLTVDFTNTSTDATSYSWDFGDGESSTEEDPSHTYDEDGTYTVILTATNDCGSVTTEEEVTIVTAPVAGFSANTTSGCTDLTVAFSDESTTNATSWEWTFDGGNPSSSTEQNPTVVYETAGTYTVTLAVSNAAGSNTITETNYIIVDEVPSVGFTSIVNDFDVDFTNTSMNATSYSWDFGDGESSTEENPSHTYDEDGEYTVVLTATNDCGSVTFTQIINIGTLPTASFSANTTSGCAPLTVQFMDQSSSNTTEWSWTFEGGNPATSSLQNPEVVFDLPGIYTVTLIAGNDSGVNTSTQIDYIVVNTIPEAGFNSNTNETVTNFVNTSIDADTYSWDFGDGESSTEENPEHDFETDGVYEVTLTATNECGSVTTTETITIVTAPTAAFTSNITSGCAPLTVQFTDQSSSNATGWAWTFDGGTPSNSTDQNPSVTFENEGSYSVSLEVSNAAGVNEVIQMNYIVVNDVPVADFEVSSAGAVIVFNNTSINGDTFIWDFGDGEGSTDENTSHTYDEDGDYEVTLTVTNECGTTVTTQTVTAVIAPIAGFNANVTSGCAPLTVEFSSQSMGVVEYYNWSFPGGNPSSSNEANPVVVYDSPGMYEVELEVGNSAGSNTAMQANYIIVNTVPVAGFTGVVTGTGINFTNNSTNATSYSWDFGDGEMSDDTNPSHDFSIDGTYTVTLTAENECGSVTFMETFEIVTEPLAGFTADETVGCADLTVNFMDLSSGNTTSWEWTFEGGNPSSSNEQNPTVLYDTPGSYNVTLIATTSAGSNTYTQNQFIIVNTVPAVDFSTNINGATVNFLNNSTGATSYLWDFGDSNSSTMANPEHTYMEDGDYTVTLTAINDCGETVTTQNISVASFPSASFEADITTGCGPLAVNFTDLSTGNVSSWNWTFTGGTPGTSTEENPSIVYADPGLYSVTLEVTNAAGTDMQTITSYILVEAIPQPDFNASITGSTAIFTNTSNGGSSYSWDFGDGESSIEENPFHVYDEDGVYTVTLTVTNSCGTVSTMQEVTVVTPPNAFFTADTLNGCAPFVVQFTDQSSLNTTSRVWTFEGGTPATSTEENPIVTYSVAGVYDVTLVASNAAGNSTAEEVDYINVGDVPTVDFSSVISGVTVDFTELATGETTYDWDFGDGESSTDPNPSHDYSGAGDFEVTLTVTNECGSNTFTETISIVGQAPTASFTADVLAGCVPLTVTFEDLSSGDPTEWSWSFPGGNPNSSTEQNPTITYANAGTYEVTLIASNPFGDNTIVESSFIVTQDVPMVGFETSEVDNGVIDFDNTSTDATSYSWDFGDGEMSTEENPSHQYSEPGAYTVILSATNDCGTVTTQMNIEVLTTGLEDFENIDLFGLYPNPNNGQFVLVLEGHGSELLTFKLINVLGQNLHSELLNYTGGRFTKNFNFKNLAAGTYIIQLSSEGKVLYKKVVIE